MKAGQWCHVALLASLLDPGALPAGGTDEKLHRTTGKEITALRGVSAGHGSDSRQERRGSGDKIIDSGHVGSDYRQGERTSADGGSVSGHEGSDSWQERHDSKHGRSDSGLNCASRHCARDNEQDRSDSQLNGSFQRLGTQEHSQTHDFRRTAVVQGDLCNGNRFPGCGNHLFKRSLDTSAKVRADPEEGGSARTQSPDESRPETFLALTQFLRDYVHYYGYSNVKLITMSHDEELKTKWVRIIKKTPTVYFEFIYINSTSSSTSPLVLSCLNENVFRSLAVVKLSSIMELGREEKEIWVSRTRECAWVVLATSLGISNLGDVTLPLDNQITFAVWPEAEELLSTKTEEFSGRASTKAETRAKVEFWDIYRAWPSLPLQMTKTGQWYLEDSLARSSRSSWSSGTMRSSRSSKSSALHRDELFTESLRKSPQVPESLAGVSVKDSEPITSVPLKVLSEAKKTYQGAPSGTKPSNPHVLESDTTFQFHMLLEATSREKLFVKKFGEEMSKTLKHGRSSPLGKDTTLSESREVPQKLPPRRKRSSPKARVMVTHFPPLELSMWRRNLGGLHLRCVTETWIPFSESKRLANGTIKIGGILEDVFEQMSIMLNFTYTCRRPEDREFGVFNNGTWSGLIGELVEGHADVAVAILDNSYHRAQYVDFATAIDFIRYIVFMRQPAPNSWANYTRELSLGSWVTLLLTAATFALALSCIARYGRQPNDELTTADAWFTVFSLMVNQGSWTVTGVPARLLLFTLVLTAWVSLAFYTSNLISALAIPSFFPPFSDLHGLLKKKTHKLGLLKGMSEVDRFRLSKDTVLRRVWQEIVSKDPDNLVPTADMAIAKVLRENFVFILEEAYFNAVHKSDCRLYQLPTKLFNYGAGLALSKNSTLTKIFNDVLLDLRSSGFVDQSRRRRYSHSLQPCAMSGMTRPMGLESIFTAFLLIGSGLAFAILLLLLELYFSGPKGPKRGKRYFKARFR